MFPLQPSFSSFNVTLIYYFDMNSTTDDGNKKKETNNRFEQAIF